MDTIKLEGQDFEIVSFAKPGEFLISKEEMLSRARDNSPVCGLDEAGYFFGDQANIPVILRYNIGFIFVSPESSNIWTVRWNWKDSWELSSSSKTEFDVTHFRFVKPVLPLL